jgi:uncharacterized repeat protein (TIGR01451 family)
VFNATQAYANIPAGALVANATPFQIALAPSFVPGTSVDLRLTVTTTQGSIQLPYRLATGTPSPQPPLINQDFNGATPPTLPAGWTSTHGAGVTTVPWQTSLTLTPTLAAFHTNDGAASRWERLISPAVVVPVPAGGAQSYITVDFDIVYNTEDEPTQSVLAYDGVLLRITDLTSGSLVRSVLAEAFAEEFTTGTANHYPKHMPRSSDPNTFPSSDMSLWAGNSAGMRHVRMKLPGAGMEGRTIQLRFEYTEDNCCTCATPPCGVAIDNVVVRQVVVTSQACPSPDLTLGIVPPAGGVVPGTTFSFSTTVTNQGTAAAAGVSVASPTPPGLTFVSNSGACTTPFPCALGSLGAGASAAITTTYSAPSSYTAPDPVVMAAAASTTTAENNTQNNGGTASAPVTPRADVGVARSGPATITPGTSVAYTVTVTNSGPSDAAGVGVADAVPAGLTFVSNSGDCTTAYPCSLGPVPAGATRTITSTYSVSSSYAAPDPVVANSTVTSSTSDPDASDNMATASAAVVRVADLSVSRTGPAAAIPGTGASYTITVANAGPSDVTASLADSVPAGLSHTGNSGDCTTAFPCALTIPSGGTRTITAQYALAASYTAPDPLLATSTVTTPATDPAPGNNTATASSAVTPRSDLSIAKIGPPTVYPGGGTVLYTIDVVNNGPSDAALVQVADPTPTGLTFLSNAGDCTTAFPCALGTLAPGARRNIIAAFSVPAAYRTPDPVVNTASVSSATADPDSSDDSASASSTVEVQANVGVAVTGPTTAVPGTQVSYTITVTNAGPSTAEGVSLANPTPAGLTFVSTTGDCAGAFPCALGTLNPSESRSATVTYSVPAGYAAPDPIVDTATVTATSDDPDLGDNTASASSAVRPSSNLNIVKTGPLAVAKGTSATFTVTVTNGGPSDAQGVVVGDPTPAGLTFVSSSGACTGAYPCALGPLAAGATRTITSVYAVPPGYSGPDPLANVASVGASTPDPDPADNMSTATVDVTEAADLALTKAGPASVTPGTPVVYTITVTNAGPSEAVSVAVADPGAAGLTFVSSSGDCATAFPCALGTMPPGATRTITSTWALAPDVTAATLSNTATVSSATGDPDLGNDSDTTSSSVTPDGDLEIAIGGPADVTAGTAAVYTVIVRNNGPSASSGVTVASAAPSGLTFAGNAGDCTTAYPCVLGTLAPGATSSFASTFQLAASATTGPLVNGVSVSAATADGTPANDSAQASSTVSASAGLSVTKTGPASVVRGTDVAYAITVANAGPSDAAGVSLADVTPPGLTFVSTAGDCATAFPCDLGTIAAGSSKTVTATFRLSPSYAAAVPMRNTATVTSTTGDPDGTDNTAAAQSDVTSRADVSIAMTGPAAAERGKDVTYTITVSNAGPSTAEAVTVANPTPAGLTFKSNAGDCTSGFPCALGSVDPGASRTITATYTVNKDAADGPLTNTASADSASADPSTGNNTVTVTLDSGPTGCGCGQTGPGTPLLMLALGLVALARRRDAVRR